MKTQSPNQLQPYIMVCNSGQSAGYATSIMQLLGYDNVYDMKWGMSAWDEVTANNKWRKNASNKYADQLETKANPKNKPTEFPALNTGETTGIEIMHARAQELLEKGFKPVRLKADELLENGDDCYIVNYWPERSMKKGISGRHAV
ncbi:MAG: rhodanese-like domain-containing protein [Bacteroidales bacterium]|nr:rhodanese-like domain-containing protein [Bacteroidales bacterium]